MRPRAFIGVLANLRRNRALARIEVAFLSATMIEWAGWLALVVYAFERGGPAEAGVIGFVVAVPAIVVAPTAAILGDRFPRSRVLLLDYVAQAVALVATAIAFIAEAPIVGYTFGVMAMALVALVRPLLASLLPEVSRTPEELAAGNVASGLGEGIGALGGSLLAGALFGIGGVAFVLLAGAATMAGAATLLLPLALRARTIELDALRPPDADVAASVSAVGRALAAGATSILADRRLAAIAGLMSVTIGVLGALNVLIVIVAIDVLGFDQDATGYLTAVTGVGAFAGSLLATSLIGRHRLAAPLLASTVMFAVAVAAVGVWSTLGPVVVALVATGVGWSIAYVAATTLTQRLAGDDVMTRVFGVNESLQTGAEAIGGLLVPVLVISVGPGGALVALGIGLGAVTLAAAPTLVRADRVDPAHLRDHALIRSIPMFAPLSGPVLERLANGAEHLRFEAGVEIIRAGESGDQYFVVDTGRVRVTVNGRDAGEIGPGGAFGEIALLRDVPRTATVRTLEPTELLAIRRGSFLEALTGQPRSRSVAADVVEERLAADRAAAG